MDNIFINDFYSSEQIGADISFLKYQIKKNCKTALIPGTGLSKLIEDCEAYLANHDVYLDKARAVHVLYTIVHALKILWFKEISFCQQLNSMNAGDYQYGKVSDDGQIFFKDLEFEIFIASVLASRDLAPTLPDHTEGNDVFCKNIEIQCKHPNVINVENIGKYVQQFHKSLIENGTFGIFALAIEDAFTYADLANADSENEFEKLLHEKRLVNDELLKVIFSQHIAGKAKILGVILTASFPRMYNTPTSDFHFVRLTNSAFCFRPDRKEIKDNHYKDAYAVLSAFNQSPTMITIEGGKIISINNRSQLI